MERGEWPSGALVRVVHPRGARASYEGGTLDVTTLELFAFGLALRFVFTVAVDFRPDGWQSYVRSIEKDFSARPSHWPEPTPEQVDANARSLFLSEVTQRIELWDDVGTAYRRVGNQASIAGPSVVLGTWSVVPSPPIGAEALVLKRDQRELLRFRMNAS